MLLGAPLGTQVTGRPGSLAVLASGRSPLGRDRRADDRGAGRGENGRGVRRAVALAECGAALDEQD